MRKFYLTNSEYLRGIRCTKALYLEEFHDEYGEDRDPSGSDGNIGMLFQRTATELIARKARDLYYQPEETERSLRSKRDKVFKCASFKTKYGDEAQIDLVFKSGASIQLMDCWNTTRLTDLDYYRAAYQYFCCKQAGFSIEKVTLVFINKDYIKDGDYTINLLRFQDATKAVKALQTNTARNIERFHKVLKGKAAPDTEIGHKCLNPYKCSFKDYCWETPSDSIWQLRSLSLEKKFSFYYKGIDHIQQLAEQKGNKLTEEQILEIASTLNSSVAIQHDKLEQWVEGLKNPMLFFLSIESFNTAMPIVDGSKPYQEIPFQYSLHYLMGDEMENKTFVSLHHCDYTAYPKIEDPRRQVAEHLSAHASLISLGKIIVFNRENEESRIEELINIFPEYKPMLSIIKGRLVGLSEVFKNHWYYHPAFGHSISLKNIVKTLCPEFTYSDLEISNHQEAVHSYLLLDKGLAAIVTNYTQALRAYSERNTLAMLKIVQFFERLTNKTIIQTNF